MTRLLLENPLLLLFVVAAIGYPLGKLTIRGTSLGVAAVLFAGIAVGALHPNLKVPPILYELGLGLFVYTLGLSNSAAFFTALKRRGIRDNLLVAGVLVLATVLTFGLGKLLHLDPAITVGIFSGSLTNTPSLAGILETIRTTAPKDVLDRLLPEPVIGYSVTYPMGVVGMILVMVGLQHLWKIEYPVEASASPELQAGNVPLINQTIRITNHEFSGVTIDRLHDLFPSLAFSRIKHHGEQALAVPEQTIEPGDFMSVVGTPETVQAAMLKLGEPASERLELDRSRFDFRRVFVSNHHLAGKQIGDLKLTHQFGAVVTRIRRGDIDLAATEESVLELGDRVRVLAAREKLAAVSKFFGDSYRESSEVDILSFSLGLALGLLVGLIPIPLGGDLHIKLGLAGGPLLVALVLGKIERTGALVWVPPYSVSQTLRLFGLVVFLAGIGTQAGFSFISTLAKGGGLTLLLCGMVVTCTTAVTFLVIGHKVLKIPMSLLIGTLSGMQTQPALLGFALDQTRNEIPNVGYASVFPVATVLKIILVQILYAALVH
ncbi:MAG: transporter [Blastocatellia bacterium]|nr:transporter [Blastocatellia bacterium]